MFSNILLMLVIWNVKLTYQASDAPKIKEFIVKTSVGNHFAETTVLSKVENDNIYTKQTTFSVVYPEEAFITGFSMHVDGNIYNSFVKEIEEAEKTYGQPSNNAPTEGYTPVYIRNSNRFTVNVDIKPKGTVTFNLTYEELLQREKGQYEIITNIQPGQLVEKLLVEVDIKENSPFLFVRTLPLRSGGNALMVNNSQLDPHAMVNIFNISATIKFQPDLESQLKFACNGLGNKNFEGFAGQFVVQYEIKRDADGGETLFQDDIFINFYAPSEIKPLLKHIVFVLDTSGSMKDTHIIQLKKGMVSILSQIGSEDLFSIVQYGESVYLWDSNMQSHDVIPLLPQYGNLASQLEEAEIPEAMKATPKNIEIAKSIINKFSAEGGTNTIGALEVGLYLVKQVQKKHPGVYLPILIFLTDGLPSVGVESTSEVISLVLGINSQEYNTPIYSLAFGDNADWNFLKDLSFSTNAKAVRIYLANDASETESDIATQLKNFYESISSPVLTDILFADLPPSNQLTQFYFPIFTNGSQLVIAGKGAFGNHTKPVKTLAKGQNIPIELEAKIGVPLTRLERIWVYLTLKQLLQQYHATSLQNDNTALKKQVVQLALDYNLTTSVTSLIVVKPNGTFSVINMVNASSGIFPETINGLPMCKNTTNWIATNFGALVSTTTDPTTEAATSIHITTTFYPITTITPDPTPVFTTDTATITSTTDDSTTTSTDITTTTTTDATTATTTTTDVTTSIAATNISSTSSTSSVTNTIAAMPSTNKNVDRTVKPSLIPIVEKTPVVYEIKKNCRDMAFGCCYDGITAAGGRNFLGCDPTPRSDWIVTNARESTTIKISTEMSTPAHTTGFYTTEVNDILESNFGINVTPVMPTTEELHLNKKIIQFCRDLPFGCCRDGVTAARGPNYSGCDPKPKTLGKAGYQCNNLLEIRQHQKTCQKMEFGCCPDGYTAAGGFNYLGCDPIPRSEACSLKASNGVQCSHALPNDNTIVTKWAYGLKSGKCRRLQYRGCGGNENRFASKRVCEKVCIKPIGHDRCKLPIFFESPKNCLLPTTLVWSYEKNKNHCIQFWYSGCLGNANKFSTKQECEELCIKPTPQETCFQRIDRGPCSNYTMKWGFNIKERRCVFFWYGGCDGNANAFDTEEKCNKICLNTFA